MVHCSAAGVTRLSFRPAAPLASAVAGWESHLPPVRLSVSFEYEFFRLGILRRKQQQKLQSARPTLAGQKGLIRFSSNSYGSHTDGDDSISSQQFAQESVVFKAYRAELRSSLATLTELLSTLSTTVTQISATVQQIAQVIESGDASERFDMAGPGTSEAGVSGPSRALRLNEADGAVYGRRDPEPWDAVEPESVASAEAGPTGEMLGAEDFVPARMLEQNSRAHKLAYQLQQAFVQARIVGLGKPFQLAIDDFVNTCREAYTAGVGLNELQLQLLLAEGSLSGAFAVRSEDSPRDSFVDEERRIRSSWVRLVYATIIEVGKMQKGATEQPAEEHVKEQNKDPIDVFVNQALKMALEEGYDLERIKLEQTYSESEDIPNSIRMMRQSQYLVVLTLEKVLRQRR